MLRTILYEKSMDKYDVDIGMAAWGSFWYVLCGLYVHYQSEKKADGTWSVSDGAIVDIYAYVYESGDVVSSGKTKWSDNGSEEYQRITGENR